MLKLHHLDRSPFGWKVRVVLAEKNVPHVAVVPENKAQDPAFLLLNPFRLTPVLQLENGSTVYESTIINEYLEEAFPNPPMLPRDPWERARIRMLEDTTDQYVYATLRDFRASQYDYEPPYLVRKKPEAVDRGLLEASQATLHGHLTRLEGALEGRDFFGGEIFSLADAGLVPPLLGTLRLVGVLPDPRYPNIARWISKVETRPSVVAAAPRQPMTLRD